MLCQKHDISLTASSCRGRCSKASCSASVVPIRRAGVLLDGQLVVQLSGVCCLFLSLEAPGAAPHQYHHTCTRGRESAQSLPGPTPSPVLMQVLRCTCCAPRGSTEPISGRPSCRDHAVASCVGLYCVGSIFYMLGHTHTWSHQQRLAQAQLSHTYRRTRMFVARQGGGTVGRDAFSSHPFPCCIQGTRRGQAEGLQRLHTVRPAPHQCVGAGWGGCQHRCRALPAVHVSRCLHRGGWDGEELRHSPSYPLTRCNQGWQYQSLLHPPSLPSRRCGAAGARAMLAAWGTWTGWHASLQRRCNRLVERRRSASDWSAAPATRLRSAQLAPRCH